MSAITVIKYDHNGVEKMRYPGIVLSRSDTTLVLQAGFSGGSITLEGITFNPGDRFIETYYSDRWYNIYEIHQEKDGRLKGWYCNVSYPAEFQDGLVSFRDLALDLLVHPDGRQIVLDRDEFDSLVLKTKTRRSALSALDQLQSYFSQKFSS